MTKQKAILLALLSSALFGLQAVLVSADLQLGSTPYASLALRGIFGMLIMYLLLRLKGGSLAIPRQSWLSVLLLALIGTTMTNLCLTASYRYMPVGLSTTLHYLYPFAVILANRLLFGTKLRPMTIAACAVAVLGVAMMANYDGGTIQPVGVLWVLGSIVAWSFQLVYYEHTTLHTLPGEAVVFYYTGCQFVIGLAAALLTGDFAQVTGSIPVHLVLNLLVILSGCFATIWLQNAITDAGSGLCAVLGIIEPLSGLLLGWLLLGEALQLRQWLACLVTLLGITLVLIGENMRKGPSD